MISQLSGLYKVDKNVMIGEIRKFWIEAVKDFSEVPS